MSVESLNRRQLLARALASGLIAAGIRLGLTPSPRTYRAAATHRGMTIPEWAEARRLGAALAADADAAVLAAMAEGVGKGPSRAPLFRG